MYMTIKMVKTLNGSGEPLDLHLREVLGDRDGQNNAQFMVRNGDGPEVEFHNRDMESAKRSLRESLRCHPIGGTINGETLEVRSFPGLGHLMIISYWDNKGDSTNMTFPDLGTGRVPADGNTLIGGVLCHVFRPSGTPRTSYYSITQEGGHHWKKLQEVTITSMLVIDANRAGELEEDGKGMIVIPKGSVLEQDTLERAEHQLLRTEQHPGVPERYAGPAYRYALANPEHHLKGAPIAVMGTPVVLEIEGDEDQDQGNSVYYTAAQALYRQESKFVPVNFIETGADTPPYETLTKIEFEVKEEEVPEEGRRPGKIRLVDGITMRYTHQETGETGEIPAEFHLAGGCWWERNIKVVRNTMPVKSLTQHLAQAYWTENEWNESFDVEEAMYRTVEQSRIEAVALLDSPQEALRQVLQNTADGFYSEYYPPEQEIEVTSQDGKITIRANPRQTDAV